MKENIELLFTGSQLSETQNIKLKCFCSSLEEISIYLKDENTNYSLGISLNRQTAIYLSKELKKQIGKIPY